MILPSARQIIKRDGLASLRYPCGYRSSTYFSADAAFALLLGVSAGLRLIRWAEAAIRLMSHDIVDARTPAAHDWRNHSIIASPIKINKPVGQPDCHRLRNEASPSNRNLTECLGGLNTTFRDIKAQCRPLFMLYRSFILLHQLELAYWWVYFTSGHRLNNHVMCRL